MSVPYFFSSEIVHTNTMFLNEETSKHCIQVLRMKKGEQLRLTDGKGNLLLASIVEEHKKHCVVEIINHSYEERKVARKVSVGISLLKNTSRLEWFLEKATEMGIYEIIPLICDRTEKQQFRHDRMRQIIIAAMLQSEQVWLPILQEPTQFEKVISGNSHNQNLIAHCEEGNKRTIHEIEIAEDVQILIGPEGDFSKQEIALALAENYLPTSLGATRLRTETAGMVATCLLINK
jgi:16S rRNA (uracil1498-N3)-methyltransferase